LTGALFRLPVACRIILVSSVVLFERLFDMLSFDL
jgi:hypothetical protein